MITPRIDLTQWNEWVFISSTPQFFELKIQRFLPRTTKNIPFNNYFIKCSRGVTERNIFLTTKIEIHIIRNILRVSSIATTERTMKTNSRMSYEETFRQPVYKILCYSFEYSFFSFSKVNAFSIDYFKLVSNIRVFFSFYNSNIKKFKCWFTTRLWF